MKSLLILIFAIALTHMGCGTSANSDMRKASDASITGGSTAGATDGLDGGTGAPGPNCAAMATNLSQIKFEKLTKIDPSGPGCPTGDMVLNQINSSNSGGDDGGDGADGDDGDDGADSGTSGPCADAFTPTELSDGCALKGSCQMSESANFSLDAVVTPDNKMTGKLTIKLSGQTTLSCTYDMVASTN